MMAVYFIQDEGGEIKIGFSQGNPHSRLASFRTGNPRELKLLVSIPGGREEEQALHERFADLRTRGEWFKPDARLLDFVETMRHVYKNHQPKLVDETTLHFDDGELEALFYYISARLNAERARSIVENGSDPSVPLDRMLRIHSDLFYNVADAGSTDGPIGDGIRAALAKYDAVGLLKALQELEREREQNQELN